MVIVLIVIFIILILFEVPKLVREKMWRELVAYSIFMLFAFLISLMLTADINMPKPGSVINHVLKDYLHLNYQ